MTFDATTPPRPSQLARARLARHWDRRWAHRPDRLLVGLVVIAIVIGMSGVRVGQWWFGNQLSVSAAGNTSGPIAVGTPEHFTVSLATDRGRAVELVGAQIRGTKGLHTEFHLVKGMDGVFTGNDELALHPVSPLRNARFSSTEEDRADRESLVASMTAEKPGFYEVKAIEVTYGSGLRRRTATAPVAIYMVAVTEQRWSQALEASSASPTRSFDPLTPGERAELDRCDRGGH